MNQACAEQPTMGILLPRPAQVKMLNGVDHIGKNFTLKLEMAASSTFCRRCLKSWPL